MKHYPKDDDDDLTCVEQITVLRMDRDGQLALNADLRRQLEEQKRLSDSIADSSRRELEQAGDTIREERAQNDKLAGELEAARARIAELEAKPPTSYPASKCGHNGYWIGHYGTCMVCRAEQAEARADKAERWLKTAQASFDHINAQNIARIDKAESALSASQAREAGLREAAKLYMDGVKSVYGGPSPLLDKWSKDLEAALSPAPESSQEKK